MNHHTSFIQLFLLLRCLSSFAQTREGNSCFFDGKVFQPGESFGQLFEIPRCGAWYEFPCYCNLDFSPPIDCPYCGILTQNNGLVCARLNETVTLINKDGILQDCDCFQNPFPALGDSYLQSTCRDSTGSNDNNDDDDDDDTGSAIGDEPSSFPTDAPSRPTNNNNNNNEPSPAPTITPSRAPKDVCTLEVNGSVQTFQDGESFGDALQTRCAEPSKYPCFCDTSWPTKIRCPYCGYATNTGELACAKRDETVDFISVTNDPTECTCLDDTSFASSCRNLSEPTPFPTITAPLTKKPTNVPTQQPATPTQAPVSVPTITPTKPETPTTASPSTAPFPTTLWPTVGIDKPSISAPHRYPFADLASPKPSPDGCFFNAKSDNSIRFVENGKAFGNDVTGPCPHEEYPVLCNTALPGKREYPYCVFSSNRQGESISIQTEDQGERTRDRSKPYDRSLSGAVSLCARSGERVLISREDGSRDLCGCLYNNPAIGPISQCKMVDFNYTQTLPTPSPTTSPSVWNKDPPNNGGNGQTPSGNTPTSSASSFTKNMVLSVPCCLSFSFLLLSTVGC